MGYSGCFECIFDQLGYYNGFEMDLTMITEVQTKESLEIDRQLKDELTKDLSPEDLSKIKRGFELYKGKVELKQFIVIMLQAMYPQSGLKARTKQVLTFIEMFLLIDLKDLQAIRFEDFTNYLIDRESGEDRVDEFQFFPCEELNSVDLQAETVFPLAGNKQLALLENNKREVSLVEQKHHKKTKSISLGGNLINNIIYIPDHDVYCIATNDKHMNFYETVDDTLVRRFSTPDTTHFLVYIEASGSIISGCTNGRIYEWSTEKILACMKKNQKGEGEDKSAKMAAGDQYKGFLLNGICKNQSDLTCMDYMGALDMLITGSNDSKVRLYDLRSTGLKLSKELDGHYKGIKAVTVSVHHKIIVSCSFDFDVLVWNAYLEHPVARLEGHEAPLAYVYCPKQFQIIISLDSKSILKIWSSEKFHLIQNIVVFENNPLTTSIRMTYKEESNLAIIYTKKLLFYKYSVNYNPRLTDDHDITAIKYSHRNLEIYVGSAKALKVWCIRSGLEKRTYAGVVDSQMTVIQIDERHRRCFMGCVNGSISSLDLFSGLVIQKYSSHRNEISFLQYNNAHNLLISGSWDRRLKVHNDTHHLEHIDSRENVLRNINNVSDKDLAGGSFSFSQMLIATHFKTPSIRLWDFEKGYLQAELLLPADVCQAQFIEPFPLLLASDIKGCIYLFTTKYHTRAPYSLVAHWKNMYSIQKSSQITYIYPVYTEATQDCLIILGDEYGYIRIISLTEFLSDNNIAPLRPDEVEKKNPYRIEDYHYNYKGASQTASTNTHDFSRHSNANLVPPPTIKQRIQIKAHNQKINYVALINESQEPMLLSASSDRLVKMWNYNGDPRGTLKQGLKDNKSWRYDLSDKWKNNELTLYHHIKEQLDAAAEEYSARRRMNSVPFTIDEKFEEATNQDIYKNLKEIDTYLHKNSKSHAGRLY